MTTKGKAEKAKGKGGGAVTSPAVASKAARVLSDETATAEERSVAASALAQVESRDKPSVEMPYGGAGSDDLASLSREQLIAEVERFNRQCVEQVGELEEGNDKYAALAAEKADLLSQLSTSQAAVARLTGELATAEQRARAAEEQVGWHKRQRQ